MIDGDPSGTFRRKTRPILADGIGVIITAIRARVMRRIVTLTGAGVVRPGAGVQLGTRVDRAVLTIMDRAAVVDSERHLDLLRSERLDYRRSVLRPSARDGPPTTDPASGCLP